MRARTNTTASVAPAARRQLALVFVPTLLALALPAAAAAAAPSVRIMPPSVSLGAGGASAEIARAPFALAFRTNGRTVLRSVTAPRPRSRRLARTRDPEPLALEQRPGRAAYAPLTMERGRERRVQWTGSFFPGNLLFAERSGRMATSGRVLAVRRVGGGVALRVATGERRRGALLVRVVAARGRGFRVPVRPASPRRVMAMSASFASPAGEAFHGFGGRHRGLDQRGHGLVGWVEQENVGGRTLRVGLPALPAILADGTGFTVGELGLPPISGAVLPGGYRRYLFPGGPNAAYYVQNGFVSSRGYAFVLHDPELSRWRMADRRRDAWQVHVSAPRLDFTVVPGGLARAVGALSALTGRHRLPPTWAQGPVLWRAIRVATPAETRASVLAKVTADLDEIARRRAPVSAYAFEGWALLGPALTRRVIARVHRLGMRAILYTRAYVANDELNSQPRGDLAYVTRHGLGVRDARGRTAFFRTAGARAVTLDLTSPATRGWWKRRLELLLSWGADGFMQDFGEHVLERDRFGDGSTGRTMHNRYPVIYHRLTASLEPGLERRFHRSLYRFTRSGFNGSTGAEMSNFPGDETSEWAGGSGIRSLTPDMLNRAVGGAFGYSTDIGGYLDRFNPPPDEELWTRWNEWAALSPFFRIHNSQTTGTRMPWFFGERAYRRWVALARLHARALPYIRRLWRAGRRTGIPPTRPLWLALPRDRRAAREGQAWMLGPDVLVAPVVDPGVRTRRLYLPPGCWRLRGAGAPRRGGRSVTVPAPLGALPYLVRCGRRPF